ncbi:hypothetical protein M378DRAFT_163179 [Amanita muscaria Koide BX008]|uniref:Uncharacterized protein n=1 Tax=Amanita muscaria (strain Koide BX008) TaxID=946122 RepID=A0A0C2X6R0_AMAMK|nr:hypothetical protein M378DRAFT_163179 [Amanita muscaria Koide BX008]
MTIEYGGTCYSIPFTLANFLASTTLISRLLRSTMALGLSTPHKHHCTTTDQNGIINRPQQMRKI